MYYSSHGPPASAHGDTIVTFDLTDPTNSSAYGFSVFKQQQNGMYDKIQTVAEDEASEFTLNNGQWMGGWSWGGFFRLFQLDSNGAVTNDKRVTLPSSSHNSGEHVALLTDNTIVYYDEYTGNFSSMVFSADSWSVGPSFSAPDLASAGHPGTTYWITDDHIVYTNDSYWTFLYTRQQDGSWLETDRFAFNSSLVDYTYSMTLYFNGYDTVVFAFTNGVLEGESGPAGVIVLNTKVNDVWTVQIITAPQLLLRNSWPALGYGSIASIGDHTMIFGAVREDSTSKKRGYPVYTEPIGRGVLIQRQNNLWVPSALIYPEDYGYLGGRVLVTNTDILLTFEVEYLSNGRKFVFQSIPRCVVEPINVTCLDVEVPTCQLDSSDPNPLAFSFGDQCQGFNVSVSVKSVLVEDFKVTADLEFERPLSTVSCKATLTCPRPPSDSIVSHASVVDVAYYAMLLVLIVSVWWILE
jgi:hypothetical protein